LSDDFEREGAEMNDLATVIPTYERQLAGLRAFVIESDFDYSNIAQEQRALVTKRKEIEADRMDISRKHREALDASVRHHKRAIELLDTAIAVLDPKLIGYRQQKEEEQRRAQAEADRVAAEARQKLLDDAAKIAAKAELAEAAGKDSKAEELMHQSASLALAADVVTAPTADVGLVKAEGIGMRWLYHAEVFDIVALARGVADGTVPASYILPNQSALNKRADSDKDSFKLPGCKLDKKPITIKRGL
jgi:hypothetical protein